MKPVTQTKVSKRDENGVIISVGNCYASCWASILEIPLEEVPKFENLPPDGTWFVKTWEWLRSLGYELEISHDIEKYPKYDHYIASGPSPRGPWDHSVVYFNGDLVHDPYPSGEGIKKVNYLLWAEKSAI
jgi:hypothetical protein